MKKPTSPPLTDGMPSASVMDGLKVAISFAVGIVLTRFIQRGWITSEEGAIALGFLPSFLYAVAGLAYRRWKNRRSVAMALNMPEGSTVEQLKTVLSSDVSLAVKGREK